MVSGIRTLRKKEKVDIDVVLRIPGVWERPEELERQLPEPYRLDEQRQCLVLPDGSTLEVHPRPADKDFLGVFAAACRELPSPEERKRVEITRSTSA